MQIVETNVGKMEAQLRNWGVKIDKVVAKAAAAGSEVKTDYHKGVEDLKAKYKVAQSKFADAKAAGSAKWEIFRTGLESAWSDLESAFKKLGQTSVGADHTQTDKTEAQAKTG